jgi:hypothetical protein
LRGKICDGRSAGKEECEELQHEINANSHFGKRGGVTADRSPC